MTNRTALCPRISTIKLLRNGVPHRAEIGVVLGADVGHGAILHACTLEDFVLIGMGAIVLDKAIVEKEVLVGAHCLVPSNKRLESGYLYLGSPAKQVRKLTTEELQFLRYSADHYVTLKNKYLSL